MAVVSIHASVKDATSDNDFVLDAAKGFNPRICKRCDDAQGGILTDALVVSIHASVKDATIWQIHLYINISVSIHASVKDATYLNV